LRASTTRMSSKFDPRPMQFAREGIAADRGIAR
jgi:hypothetical protein